MIPEKFQTAVLNWFDQFGRKDLPWQQSVTPYRVWVSEIMLQQTQVTTVIPYFNRFITKFPTVQDLADADLDEVLGLWSGLGYYARARNLHHAAQTICVEYGGKFPEDLEKLQNLKGVGRSTAGAILSMAVYKKATILDGNVKRVLARFHTIEGWTGETSMIKKLWEFAEYYTPIERIADYTQAMMDLGALVCTRTKPHCLKCPLQSDCRSYQTNCTDLYPTPKKQKKQPVRSSVMLILMTKESILLYQRPKKGIWGGLWSFPEYRTQAEVEHFCIEQGIELESMEFKPAFRHTFSHFHLDITPVIVNLSSPLFQVMDSGQVIWYKLDEAQELGIPVPVRKLINELEKEIINVA